MKFDPYNDFSSAEGTGSGALPKVIIYGQTKVPVTADQTIKADAGKPRLTLVPTAILTAIARVREYGVEKYGASESWKRVSPDRYRDAMFRHMVEYIRDPASVDAESKLPHLWHLACNAAFLCELENEENGTGIDDHDVSGLLED